MNEVIVIVSAVAAAAVAGALLAEDARVRIGRQVEALRREIAQFATPPPPAQPTEEPGSAVLLEVYRATANEADRYRDWPIRVLTFTSVLHFAVIGAIIIKNVRFSDGESFLFSVLLIWVGAWTVYHFYRGNKNYVEARKVQARLHEAMRIHHCVLRDGKPVLPAEWMDYKKEAEGPLTRFGGWGFYVLYAAVLTAGVLWALWCR